MEASMEKTNEFGHFDMVSDYSDHHFVGSNNGNCFHDSKSIVYRSIMKEWKILKRDLPESIYVRVYEQRIDLMRAVIVGARGTPYHDGLFFFDIAFPSDYPNRPPKMYYHSFGYRVNPNLYNNGKVCLSLLNTWQGRKTELWDPSGSTMLQVLVSIQGLVLNEKPFFNEPWQWRLSNSENRSRVYNENAFMRTCYTSFHMLERPPRNFEPFITAHFRQRAVPILAACSDYMTGCVRVGYYSCDSPSSTSTVRVSADFKEQMITFYPQLFQAFRLKAPPPFGAFLPHFNTSRPQSNNKPTGIFKRFFQKIKHTFGWKNTGNKKTSHIQPRHSTLHTSSK
ncbi:hypothetical protein VNO78_22808 [Psophocarpus tetragonolobus]|uniref:UBC core domain-containing protein n=1 Tax=Psophocarpus tetragonolobus TaxID=3891 RepID=A0AAN9S5J0_PSOTE